MKDGNVEFTLMDSSPRKEYSINYDKIQTLEDIVAVFKGMNLYVSISEEDLESGDHQFVGMMHLLQERDGEE